jgi:hypothetical protein
MRFVSTTINYRFQKKSASYLTPTILARRQWDWHQTPVNTMLSEEHQIISKNIVINVKCREFHGQHTGENRTAKSGIVFELQ